MHTINTVDSLLKGLSLTPGEILDMVELPSRNSTIVFVSGSLVAGYGNSWSDLDVYCLGDGSLRGFKSASLETSTHLIEVTVTQHQRLDFEFWPRDAIHAAATKLNESAINNFVRPILSKDELEFVYRMQIGIPLLNAQAFLEERTSFPSELFRCYLASRALLSCGPIYDDLAGCQEASDAETTLVNAQLYLDASMDAFRHACGDTNPATKWRAKLVTISRGTLIPENIANLYSRLRFPNLSELLVDASLRREYVDEIVAFCEDLCDHAQVAKRELMRSLGHGD